MCNGVSGAGRLFPDLLTSTPPAPHMSVFIMDFYRMVRAGSYGSYDNTPYFNVNEVLLSFCISTYKKGQQMGDSDFSFFTERLLLKSLS